MQIKKIVYLQRKCLQTLDCGGGFSSKCLSFIKKGMVRKNLQNNKMKVRPI